MPINILSTANAPRQELYGDKIRLGDTAETELQTETQVDTRIETKVPTIVPAKSSQVTVRSGVAEIDTLFLEKTGSEVTFVSRGHYAGQFTSKVPTKPKYHQFSISKTGAILDSECVMEISAMFIPAVLVTTKPDSLLPTYGSQALMTADFANQTAGQHYYFTGSTSAWLYNGTATDNIANYTEVTQKDGWKASNLKEYDDQAAMLANQAEQTAGDIYFYAGSDSGWRKGTASTGVIGDYTELPEEGKWKEWGTRPEWLIVEGDPFITGLSNLNVLKFKYYRHEKVGSQLYVDKVVCKVIAVPNGNYDATPEIPSLIKLTFDENADPVTSSSVVNTGTYAEEFPITVAGLASEAFYELISGTNYAFVQGTGSPSQGQSTRARLECTINEKALRYFENQRFTVIVDFSLVVGLAPYSRRTFFSSENGVAFRGFSVSTGDVTPGQFRVRLGTGSGFASFDCPTPPTVAEDGIRHFLAVTWTPVNGGANGGSMKFYYKCTENSVPFTYWGEITTGSARYINNGNLLIGLTRRDSGSGMDPDKRSYMEVIPEVLTQAQIEAIATIIHP